MHTLRFSLCQIIFCGMAISQVNRDYLVRPFAGGALPDGIPGLSADLDPFGLAADSAGNVYIAPLDMAAVFRLDSSGTLTRVAGTGVVGFRGDGGPAREAELSDEDSLAVGPDGALYISEFRNNRIRKVAGGVITTVAGGGSISGDGVPATSAILFTPGGVAVDSSGNLYFAERQENRVRRASDGFITTIPGGPATRGLAATEGRRPPRSLTIRWELRLRQRSRLRRGHPKQPDSSYLRRRDYYRRRGRHARLHRG